MWGLAMENNLNSVALCSESTGRANFCCSDSFTAAPGISTSMLVTVNQKFFSLNYINLFPLTIGQRHAINNCIYIIIVLNQATYIGQFTSSNYRKWFGLNRPNIPGSVLLQNHVLPTVLRTMVTKPTTFSVS